MSQNVCLSGVGDAPYFCIEAIQGVPTVLYRVQTHRGATQNRNPPNYIESLPSSLLRTTRLEVPECPGTQMRG